MSSAVAPGQARSPRDGTPDDFGARRPSAVAPRGGPLPQRGPGRPQKRRSRAAKLIRPLRDWLDRPMTSFHLVLALFALLLSAGLLMVLSASSISSYRTGQSALDKAAARTGMVAASAPAHAAFTSFFNQAIFAGLGLVAFVFAMRVSPNFLRRLSWWGMLISLALLAAVLIPGLGTDLNGARSWIYLGPFSFQPSELAKLALLLWMAHLLAAKRPQRRAYYGLALRAGLVFVIMVGLIMLQPDLGTTITLCLVFFAVLWFSGLSGWIFAVLLAVGVVGSVGLGLLASYRVARIDAWLHPNYTNAYQLFQGLFGLGHGGWFGVGLGQSMEKWGALPNADSDFIFAIVGEELGLIGTGILVLLYGLLAYTGLRIYRRNYDPFLKIVAGASTVWLVGQAAINICYVVGLLPVTGIPLPMISRGGTSLLVTMVVFGLLANFARHEPQAAAALYTRGPGRIGRFLGLEAPAPGESVSPQRLVKIEARKQRRLEKSEARRQRAKEEQARRHAERVARDVEFARRKAAAARAAAGDGRRPAGAPDRARTAARSAGRPMARGEQRSVRPDSGARQPVDPVARPPRRDRAEGPADPVSRTRRPRPDRIPGAEQHDPYQSANRYRAADRRRPDDARPRQQPTDWSARPAPAGARRTRSDSRPRWDDEDGPVTRR